MVIIAKDEFFRKWGYNCETRLFIIEDCHNHDNLLYDSALS